MKKILKEVLIKSGMQIMQTGFSSDCTKVTQEYLMYFKEFSCNKTENMQVRCVPRFIQRFLKSLVAVLAILTISEALNAVTFADSLKTISNVTYKYSDNGDCVGKYTGWAKNSEGKCYYKNGVKVTKSTNINGVRYKFNEKGICTGKYTGWAKNSEGRVYYKDGIKVTKNTTINGVRYKFNEKGICTGKYTGFVKNSRGRRYYKNGELLKDQIFKIKGKTYNADSFGDLLCIEDNYDINPGCERTIIKDLIYNGEKYYLFISTEAFIYGEDGKCYCITMDYLNQLLEPGYKLKENLKEDKELTELLNDEKPAGKLKYTDKEISSDFEITVKEFDNGYLYINGKPLDDYGLTVVSSEPFCHIDGVAVYLYTDATKYLYF